MAGSDAVFDALLKKFGAIRVDDLEELIGMSCAFAVLDRLPESSDFVSISLSGGETGICADLAEMNGIKLPELSEETSLALSAMLPSYANPVNPLDATATLSYDENAFAACLRTLMKDKSCSAIIIGYTLLGVIIDPAIRYMAAAIEMVSRDVGAKPMLLVPFVGGQRNVEFVQKLERCGVPILPPALYAFRIIRRLAEFISYEPSKYDMSLALPDRESSGLRVTLSEGESRRIALKYGIHVPKGGVARTVGEAEAIAGEIGYPVALKIDSRGIPHKSDIGCVKLGVSDVRELTACFGKILDNAKAHSDAELNGVGVYEMKRAATELIMGVKTDPFFGPVILVGMGGIFTEIVRDTALSLAPITRDEALEMLASLSCARLLEGVRGIAPRDVDALADILMSLSDIAVAAKDVYPEVDLNPVSAEPDGACALDALFVLDESGVGVFL
jgi:acetyltransferase